VLPRAPIEPGRTELARLRLERPVVARAEDRFVLRSYSPVATIGGGRVLDPQPPRRRSVWPAELASRAPGDRFRSALARRPDGVPVAALPILLGITKGAAAEVARAEQQARLLGDVWVSAEVVAQTGRRALALLKEYHRQHMSEPGMPLETLRHSLQVRDVIVEAALADCGHAGRLRRLDGVVALAGFVPRVAGGEAEIERVMGILLQAHLMPPTISELERSTGRQDIHALLRLAAARGRVEAVERDRYYTREALDHFTDALQDLGREGEIIPATVRDHLGITRKYLIPLLEWADLKGITMRVGEGRRLKSPLTLDSRP
jgi:selenocysteine-specific elongation factor